jgi:hypothetical protein
LLDRPDVRVTFRAGPPPPGLAPVFSVYDDSQREVLLVGVDRTSLVVRLRTPGTTFRLHPREERWVDRLAGLTEGDTVKAAFGLGARGYCFTVNEIRDCSFGPNLGSGWQLLVRSSSVPTAIHIPLTVAWATGLGFFLGFATRRTRAAALITGIALVTAWWIPYARVTVESTVGLILGIALWIALGDPTSSSSEPPSS